MNRCALLVFFWGLLTLAGPGLVAAEGSTTGLVQGVTAFNSAFDAWSYEGFVDAAGIFAAEAQANPTSSLAFYWQGVADFHAVLWCGRQEGAVARNRAEMRLQLARKSFEAALLLKPNDAECHALLSALMGMQIAQHPSSAVWRGPSVLRHQRLALRNGPDNPRVHYLIGCGYYHAPSLLGDRQKALAHFIKAEPLFDEEAAKPPVPIQPLWGRSSCLTFMGKLYEEAGDQARAEQYFQKALKANPHDQLAQQAWADRKK
jgi:tetratricopeptide (TPR) repeat protein